MKYQIERPDPPRRQWIYLMAWFMESGELTWNFSDKAHWFRQIQSGRQVDGQYITYCIHRPYWEHGRRITDKQAVAIAKCHFYGQYRIVSGHMGFWERGVVVTRPSNMRKITT